MQLALILPAADAQLLHLAAQALAAQAALAELAQRAHQLLLVDRLEQIIAHAEADGALRIFEMRIAADDGNLQLRVERLGALDQLQAVAARHADIRDEDVRLARADQLQRLKAVGRNAGELHPQRVPVDQHPDEAAYPCLVVGDDHLEHAHTSLFPIVAHRAVRRNDPDGFPGQ